MTMKGNTDIWSCVLKFLGDCSIASVSRTCRTLYLLARHELKLRAGHYLRSDNAWEHGFYPAPGYYGTLADDERHESEDTIWVRCSCEHHVRLSRGESCSCAVCSVKLFGPRFTGQITVQGVTIIRQTIDSSMVCRKSGSK